MTSNGDKETTIKIPLKKGHIQLSMGVGTFLWICMMIGMFLLGKGRISDILPGGNNDGHYSAIEEMFKSNTAALKTHIEWGETENEKTSDAIQNIMDWRKEDRRFMIALFKQVKALCEFQGVDILYEPEDFFSGGTQ